MNKVHTYTKYIYRYMNNTNKKKTVLPAGSRSWALGADDFGFFFGFFLDGAAFFCFFFAGGASTSESLSSPDGVKFSSPVSSPSPASCSWGW